MKTFLKFFDKYKKIIIIVSLILLLTLFILPLATKISLKRNGIYTSKEEVALYIKQYHELPSNYITKEGYDFAISHGLDYSDKIIGGDSHWNSGQFTNYHVKETTPLKEADISFRGYTYINRGDSRIVYTTNVANPKVFYTDNNYSTFKELDDFSLQLVSNIFWIIFSLYLIAFITFYILIIVFKLK